MTDGRRVGSGDGLADPAEETGPSGYEIAIVGMAGRFPGADDLETFWENLEAGVESISTFSDEELRKAGVPLEESSDPHYVRRGGAIDGAETFDARFFGFYPREAEILDPQHRVLLECAWEALEHAGYLPGPASGVIGVYAGAGANTYLVHNLLRNREVRDSVHGYQLTLASDKDFLCTRISYKLDLRGPSVTVQTGCSTSLVAVHLACQGLLGYHCDVALAGGVTIRPPLRAGYQYQEGGIASPTGRCRAFDAAADGTVPGAGAGLVVLKRLSDAISDGDHVHAVIRGSAVNNDGADKVGYTAPSVTGQAETIAAALVVSDVHPESIGYVEAHGTGTSLGDPIEIAALSQAYRDLGAEGVGTCPIGSVKTNIGHLDAAAGVVSLLKTVMAIERRVLPPSLHFERPNPAIDFGRSPFFVNAQKAEWRAPRDGRPRRAAVSSFGMGGTNAHLILEEAPAPVASGPSRDWKLVLLSARTVPALEASTDRLADRLRRRPDLDLADVAWTLQVGRKRFEHVRAVVCRDTADFVDAVAGRDPKRCFDGRRAVESRTVAFLFSGQGAQYVGMGRELYRLEPAFRRAVDDCAEILEGLLGLDIRTVLYPEPSDDASASGDRLSETWLTQPALFVVEYALAELWKEWGIQPDAMLGHSIGEYVAACVAGVFSLEEGLSLVAERGRLMQSMPSGSMLAVQASESRVGPLLVPHASVAAVNAPDSCVVSGPTDAVETLRRVLEAEGIACTALRTSHAFHSAMMEPILGPFTDRVSQVRLRAPAIPFLSNVTGTWITDGEATDPAYWARHLRYPVRFAEGVGELLREPSRVLLEVGPGTTLTVLAGANAGTAGERDIFPSIRHPRDARSDVAFLLGTVGRLAGVGIEPDWRRFNGAGHRSRVPLPTYPFERQRYWVDPDARSEEPAGDGGRPRRSDRLEEWFWVPTWKRAPAPAPAEEGPLLVLSDSGFGRELAERLATRGTDAIDAGSLAADDHRDGDPRADPLSEAGLESLLERLEREGRFPRRIAHVVGLTEEVPSTSESGPGASRPYRALRNLCSALGRVAADRDVELVIVTSGLQDVLGDEPLTPVSADVLGLCDVVGQEVPRVRCRSVDVVWRQPGPGGRDQLLDRLAEEIRGEAPDRTVALRGRHRWVRSFERVSLPVADGTPPIRAGGVYLVTGGLGRVGLVLAQTIARIAPVRIALLGRSAFPLREDWNDWLSSHDPEDPTSDRIRRVRAIEASGAEVRIFQGDVTDPVRMSDVAAEIRERFGRVEGV
ncbi:MAG: type I polyketide synthase, partial [Gemmatimonadota bacterium]